MSQEHNQRPMLVYHYERYLVDQNVSAFVRSVSNSYTVGGLERLVCIGDRAARRGAVLALSRMADYRSNAIVGKMLGDSDRGVRSLAEDGIRRLWMRIGTPSQQRHLVAISEHLEEREYDRASQLATTLVEEAPWIAQGWFFRGKAFFHLAEYEASIQDCHQALEINCYHFPAASIMGQAYQLQDNPVAALDAYRRALRLNPSMEEVRAQVIYLQRTLKGE